MSTGRPRASVVATSSIGWASSSASSGPSLTIKKYRSLIADCPDPVPVTLHRRKNPCKPWGVVAWKLPRDQTPTPQKGLAHADDYDEDRNHRRSHSRH